MLTDISFMTDSDVYEARYEIAGAIVNAKGLMVHYSRDADTRGQSMQIRDLVERSEARLLSVTRP